MVIAPTEPVAVPLLFYPLQSDRSSKYSWEPLLPLNRAEVFDDAFYCEARLRLPVWLDVGGRHTCPAPQQFVVVSANP